MAAKSPRQPGSPRSLISEDAEPCVLRIISINDVYELDNFAHFPTAKAIESVGCTKMIATLAGDFLAPSLLSSLDKGHGKVDCMNMAGIDYVCFGNHEDDVPNSQMLNRIRESKFTWINSNMQSLSLPPDIPRMPEYVVIDVKNGSQHRRVALLGLNTEDPGLYKPHAFGGCTIEPLNETAAIMSARVKAEVPGIDCIVPLTHQLVPLDRELAMTGLELGFPVIIGGHDHEEYLEEVNGCHIVKAGQEAQTFAFIDLVWYTPEQVMPTVKIMLRSAKLYPRDPDMEAVIKKHNRLTQELDKAVLCAIPEGLRLSSQGIRLKQTTMGTFLTSTVRNLLSADCAFLCSGNIRADKSYANLKAFTYSHLKAELPFDCKIVTIPLPGRVVAEIIEFSRSFALLDPPVVKGCYMQLDDGIEWDRDTNKVLAIRGRPLEPDKTYIAAVNVNIVQGVDDIEPLLRYMRQLAEEEAAAAAAAAESSQAVPPPPLRSIKRRASRISVPQCEDRALELKNIMVDFYSKLALYDMLVSFDFDSMDLNKDGFIDLDELMAAARRKAIKDGRHKLGRSNSVGGGGSGGGDEGTAIDQLVSLDSGEVDPEEDAVSVLMLTNLLKIADKQKIDKISKEEILSMCFSMDDGIHFAQTHKDELYTYEEFCEEAHHILGAAYDEGVVRRLFERLDLNGDGFVSHAELAAIVITKGELDAVIV